MNKMSIPVPDGCNRIEVEFDPEKNILITKFCPKNVADKYCELTGKMETCAGIGDLAIMWNDGLEYMAIISVVKEWEVSDRGVEYKAANEKEYTNAIKFRNNQQYFDILGIK